MSKSIISKSDTIINKDEILKHLTREPNMTFVLEQTFDNLPENLQTDEMKRNLKLAFSDIFTVGYTGMCLNRLYFGSHENIEYTVSTFSTMLREFLKVYYREKREQATR